MSLILMDNRNAVLVALYFDSCDRVVISYAATTWELFDLSLTQVPQLLVRDAGKEVHRHEKGQVT